MPVADTSRAAFEQIVPRLSARQRLILSALETWEGRRRPRTSCA